MNHVLDHKGYRFFQASFDQDEKGTVLSVNHDYWGSLITYIGYFLLYLGLMAILFNSHTRFASLKEKLEKVKTKKKAFLGVLLLLCAPAFSQNNTPPSKEEALKFFTDIKDNYDTTPEAASVDALIGLSQ